MVYTADEPSYTAPPVNFIHQGIWRDHFEGNSSYYQRTPGYGMIYGTCYLLFKEQAFTALRTIQLLCFFLSLLLIGKIFNSLLKNETAALMGSAFYGFIPIYSGFTAYTLTEGITPFLVIWTIYSLTSESRSKHAMVFLSTAILMLVRPQLAFLPVGMLVYQLIKGHYRTGLIMITAFLPILIWQIRSISIEGKLIGIHPIYSETNISLYRPGHEALTDLFRIWEHDGEKFHSFTGKLLKSDSVSIDQTLEMIPMKFRSSVEPLALEYSTLLHDPSYGRTELYKRKERSFVLKVQHTREKLIAENKIQYYFITPLQSAKFLLTKSQLNQFIFQSTYRGNPFIEGLRILSVVTILSGVFFLFYYAFQFKNELLTVLSVAVLSYLFYLFFFQRMNEDRYLVPFLPILLIVSVQFLKDQSSYLKRIFSKNL